MERYLKSEVSNLYPFHRVVMKYWNKNKLVRQRCWARVDKPTVKVSNEILKVWCQQQPSQGKFYYYYGSTTWWFENAEFVDILKEDYESV